MKSSMIRMRAAIAVAIERGNGLERYLRADRASAGLVSALNQILVPDIFSVNGFICLTKRSCASICQSGQQ